MDLIKIYGLRRTGTNYLQWLLKHNFENICLLNDQTHWKHGIPKHYNDVLVLSCFQNTKDYLFSKNMMDTCWGQKAINYILCVKDPYSWYLSICKWNNVDPFPLTKDKLSILYTWNYMMRQYERFYYKEQSVMYVQYEELIKDVEQDLSRVAQCFNLKLNKDIVDYDCDIYSGQSFDREYYLKSKYLKKYSIRDLLLMNDFLDQEYIQRFCYDPKITR